jgi:hypothetical protein
LWRVALFFKNDMDNPSSNFTWSKIKCIPIACTKRAVYLCCMRLWPLH